MASKRTLNIVIGVLVVILLLLIGTTAYLAYKFFEEPKKEPLRREFKLEEVDSMTFTSDIEEGAILGAHWFGRAQRTDGSYVYIFDPDNDTEIEDHGYSLARHSASIYGLVWAYDQTGDERYLQAAELAADYTETYMKSDGDLRYIKKGSYSSLFDNALALIGYNYLYRATSSGDHLEKLTGLADVCVISMNDMGQFDYKYDYGDFEESHMASGEALLGLALSYQSTGDQKYLDSYTTAFNYHANYYTYKNCRNMSTAVYSWMSSAFSEGYRITGEARFKEAAYKLSDWIITNEFGRFFKNQFGQYDYEEMKMYPECIGSFKSYPSMNTCTYTEGMGDVLGIAIMAGDTDRIEKYKAVLLNASTFVLELMYDVEDSNEFDSPNLTVGGYRHDLFDTSGKDWQSRWIRIDYTQHAIGGLFRMLWHIPADEINEFYTQYPHFDLYNGSILNN